MARHVFPKELVGRAKTSGRSLIAWAYRGRTFDVDYESQIDDATGCAILQFAMGVVNGDTDKIEAALKRLGIVK